MFDVSAGIYIYKAIRSVAELWLIDFVGELTHFHVAFGQLRFVSFVAVISEIVVAGLKHFLL